MAKLQVISVCVILIINYHEDKNVAEKNSFSDKEREFFRLVTEAVSANPFSEERDSLNKQIAGFFNFEISIDPLEQTIQEVKKRLLALSEKTAVDIKRFSKRDGELLLNTILFDFFHTYLEDFDRLILRQIEAGNSEVKVEFAGKAISDLLAYGFDKEDAVRYFSLSYQLRRAFYFIDRSLIGQSSSMRKLKESLWNNVFTSDINLYESYLWNRMEDFSTMILGETGTGKGQAAMAIGRSGYIPFNYEKKCFKESFTNTFISINLSQFSETLIESELFGHRKGSFTGAVTNYDGVFSKCSPYGAIFLDEIGEVSHSLQIKLLKVLEERIFSSVGSRDDLRFEGRVIAATNQPVDKLIKKGHMREDFFYRLCSDLIYMPPLRTRINEDNQEIEDLIQFTINKIVGKSSPELVSMVSSEIRKFPGRKYSWPGNVRELGQCIRRILLNREYKQYNSVAASTGGLSDDFIAEISSGELTAQQLLTGYCYHLYEQAGTFGEVARKTGLDRRTVKKYIDDWLTGH